LEKVDRFITLGESQRMRLLVVVSADRGDRIRIISARPATRRERKDMKKAAKSKRVPDMLDEYDFSSGVRGKYAKRYAEGTNVVLLDRDVAAMFPDSQSVNEALRALVQIARGKGKRAKP
jgi:Ribonuclease toxin, BrnT, of type II toxin-antitoxin system